MRRRTSPSYVPISRQRRRVQGTTAVAVGAGLVLLAIGLLVFWPDNPPQDDDKCVLVLVADKSSSSDSGELAAQRADEAGAVLDEWSVCAHVIVSEIRQFYGQARFEVIPMSTDSSAWAERKAFGRKAVAKAHQLVDEIFSSPPGGRTNALATMEELADQVAAISEGARVEVFFWWDGIQSVRPLNMRRLFAGTDPADPYELLARTKRFPACDGWRTRFVGVNRTAHGDLPSSVVERADDYWHAFIEECGGELVTYSPTLALDPIPTLAADSD